MKEEIPAPLRCLIVDDERAAHKTIQFHIEKVSWVVHAGSCMNAISALEQISAIKPDIIFLDVDMPHLSGMDLLKIAGDIGPSVIMTTAHEEFALQGYEHNVCDFLLKPISFERFLKAVNKLRLLHERQPNKPDDCCGAVSSDRKPDQADPDAVPWDADSLRFGTQTMWITVDKNIVPVSYRHIYLLKAYGNYVQVCVKDKIHLIRSTLTILISNLPPKFIQTHRSYIVNSELVGQITGNEIIMAEAEYKARISKQLRADVLRKLHS